jgi:hypothetical protein
VLLGPARILVLLPVFSRLLLPRIRRLATLDRLVLLSRVPLFGHGHDGGIVDLSAARGVALRAEMLVEVIERFLMTPALASFSRNNHNVVPSGMQFSIPEVRNRVNERRSRT